MGNVLNFNVKEPEKNVQKLYSIWKRNKLNTGNYTIISNSLKDYLKYIRTPAINLYLLYAMAADNNNGDSYYSIDSLAKILKVSKKTIDNWNTILIDLGLINREQTFNSSARTYLLPTSDMVLLFKNDKKFEEYKEIVKTENFKKNKILNIIELSNKQEYVRYTCHQYSRKYIHKYKNKDKGQAEIIRNNFIVKKQTDIIDQITYSNFKNSIQWGIDKEGIFTMFFNKNDISHGQQDSKQELKNLETALFQLITNADIDNFKEKYQELPIK